MTAAIKKSAPATAGWRKAWVAVAVCGLLPLAASAQSSAPRNSSAPVGTASPATLPAPLPVDEAFPITAALERGKYVLRVDVMPGHYLYRDRFELSAGGRALANLSLPKGKMKQDPNFGRVEIYDQPLQLVAASPAAAAGELKLVYQGCSEEAGVCYPPTTRTFRPAADGKEVAAVEGGSTSFKQQFRKRVSQ